MFDLSPFGADSFAIESFRRAIEQRGYLSMDGSAFDTYGDSGSDESDLNAMLGVRAPLPPEKARRVEAEQRSYETVQAERLAEHRRIADEQWAAAVKAESRHNQRLAALEKAHTALRLKRQEPFRTAFVTEQAAYLRGAFARGMSEKRLRELWNISAPVCEGVKWADLLAEARR